MTIQIGDRIPSVTLHHMTGEGPAEIATEALFGGKRVAVFGLPGAFTPTCSAKHLPGYAAAAGSFKAKGVETIACVSVNDAFVMNAWGRQQGLEHVKLIPDGSGDFTRRMGMLVCKDDLGFGLRSWRYAAIVNDGVVEAWFEEPGISDNCATDPYGESAPQNILDKLAVPAAV